MELGYLESKSQRREERELLFHRYLADLKKLTTMRPDFFSERGMKFFVFNICDKNNIRIQKETKCLGASGERSIG